MQDDELVDDADAGLPGGGISSYLQSGPCPWIDGMSK